MPLTGKLLVQVTFKSKTAGFNETVFPNIAGQNFSPDNDTVTVDYGLNGVLRLTGDITGDFARVDLPLGFQVTSITPELQKFASSPGVDAILTWGAPVGPPFPPFYCGTTVVSSTGSFTFVSLTSSPGFTDSDTFVDDVRAEALLYPFTVTFRANCSDPLSGGAYNLSPSATDSDYPFYWQIASWEIPDVVGPPPSGAPIVEVVPGGINVTAGPGTTTVVVTNPGTVIPIIVSVTPGVLVFIPIVPPNNPVVTVTPLNGPVVGTPTVVAVPPQFDYTMAGGINLGGSPALQFIGNPSGIYTLVPGKAYDTLYERIPAVTSQDVKIPDPFIVTAYVGE